jgi:hypothetical protein
LRYLYCHNNFISDTSALEAWLVNYPDQGQVLPQYAGYVVTFELNYMNYPDSDGRPGQGNRCFYACQPSAHRLHLHRLEHKS